MTIRHLYPAVEPSLNLDFANSKKLDSRITFTRASTGTYTDESGIIRTAAANEARFDHDNDGNSLGLLIEESRTNSMSYSNEFSTNWSFGGAGVGVLTPNAAIAPDGTWSASKLAAEETHWLTRGTPLSVASNTFVKFNLSTGTFDSVIATSSATYGITKAGNGWYRVHLTVSNITFSVYAKAGELSFIAIQFQGSSAYIYSADGGAGNTTQGIYIWGAQLETGSFPTSYIPTSGSTVTRSADLASMTGTNFSSWYNQSEGTLYQDCTTRVPATALNPDVGVGAIMTASGNVQLGFYQVLNTSNLNAVVYQTATAYSANLSLSGAWTQNVPSKAALAYKQNSFAASADGATPQTDSSGIVPIPNALDIGQLSTFPSNHIGAGTFARLTYYPVRLPDATLQALTL